MKRGNYEYYTNGITIEQLNDIARKLATNKELHGKTIKVKNSLTYEKMARIRIGRFGNPSITILDYTLFDVI